MDRLATLFHSMRVAERALEIDVREDLDRDFAEYAKISIAFTVERVLDVSEGPDGVELRERRIAEPYVKDYDELSSASPVDWPQQLGVLRSGLLVARARGMRVGGALVVVHGAAAALWDLRVAPELRGWGVGTALFRAAERWARERGCAELRIETQNVNTTACRFYARRGCEIAAVDPFAYPDLPDEIRIDWRKALA